MALKPEYIIIISFPVDLLFFLHVVVKSNNISMSVRTVYKTQMFSVMKTGNIVTLFTTSYKIMKISRKVIANTLKPTIKIFLHEETEQIFEKYAFCVRFRPCPHRVCCCSGVLLQLQAKLCRGMSRDDCS